MAFEVSFPTRHTDCYASTGFVHAGVLLALTEMAYAQVEAHLGIDKGSSKVAVQRSTTARYAAPLPWQEGAVVSVVTTSASERGFEQEFAVRSAASGTAVATIAHQWVWLDLETGRAAAIPAEVVEGLLGL